MQKVLRRSLLARNQALRKARKVDKQEFKKEQHEFHRDRIMREKAQRGFIKDERKTRREDWLLGPLAPQRDVGDQKGIYGAMSVQAYRNPQLPQRERPEYVNFAVEDRVCIVKGRSRGRIGEIKNVNYEQGTVDLEGMNTVYQQLPEFAQGKGEQRRPPYQAADLPIPLDNVRLVVPIPDEVTGDVKDTVIRHLRGGDPIVEREYGVGTPKHTRYIEGLDIEIPWPDPRPADYKAEDVDTLRMTVEERTYVPSINEPYSASIIDELQNPFDRLRSRHQAEWVEEKLKEDALEAWQRRRRLMTPQTEYLEQKVKEKRPPEISEPSNELLQMIREVQSETLGKRKTVRIAT